MAKIYLASSWRNEYQPALVKTLRTVGHEVYDFRNPPNGTGGFTWSQIDPKWKEWGPAKYKELLYTHPVAREGFYSDFSGMKWADTCVLLLPSGRSAHSEAGWMAGAGKRVLVYIPQKEEPDLMYLLYDKICITGEELLEALI